MKQQGVTLWFTGLSGSGKTTICRQVEAILQRRHIKVERLDGDVTRKHLAKDLGFSREDRMTNIERVAYVASLLSKHQVIVLAAFISPYEKMRAHARRTISCFHEIYVKCPLQTCVERDVKGLYRKAINGEIKQFTGISDPYEPPKNPDLTLETDKESIQKSVVKVIAYLEDNGFIPKMFERGASRR